MADLRILVVDDQKAVCVALQRVLGTHAGWEVVGTAMDGVEALGKAKDLKPDIVVMDLTMPEMNGLEATPLIKRAVPDTEILIFSLHGSTGMVKQAQNAGATGYVSKARAKSIIPAIEAMAQHKPFFDTEHMVGGG